MGVGIFVDFFEAVDGDVGVNLGGGEGFMAQEFLYDAEVCAGVEHVGGEGMSQGVWCDFATTGEYLLHVFIYAALDGAGGDGTATEVYKHLVVFGVGYGRANVEVVLHGLEGVFTEVGDAFFAAFTHDADGALLEVDVGQGKCSDFGGACTGGVEGFEEGAVPFAEGLGGVWGFEEGGDFGDGEDFGEFAGEFWGFDELGGIDVEFAFADEVAVGRTEGGEFSG